MIGTVSYVIMAHVQRERLLKHLKLELHGNPDSKTVKVSMDDGTLGVWGNARRAWNMTDKRYGYGMVIQDDAILCNGFLDKARKFIREHYGQVISFYYGSDRPQKHIQPDHFTAPLYHAVALAIPTHQIPDMITYCDRRHEAKGDDMKIQRWLISQGRTCTYSNPSLVQHRTDIPSIVNELKPIRQSTIFQA